MCVCGDSGEKWICSIIMLRKSTDSKLLLSQGRKNGVNKLTKEKESSIRQRHPNAKTKIHSTTTPATTESNFQPLKQLAACCNIKM